MHRQDYTVGWICALQMVYVAAWELLEEEHSSPPIDSPYDDNNYTLCRIGDHHIVIACLSKGRYGIASAASVAKDMLRSFESIRIGLMVGIGGGAPSRKHDIRLGDIMVGCPIKKEGGVVPYNFGKAVQEREFEQTGSLNSPPTVLLTALTKHLLSSFQIIAETEGSQNEDQGEQQSPQRLQITQGGSTFQGSTTELSSLTLKARSRSRLHFPGR